ncbi:DUF6496 domain-containing protein [Bradyrhizobium sp. ISRA435]|nr:DUF6496 domain-containing protein [Bradyrhizobium sp. ISRA435]
MNGTRKYRFAGSCVPSQRVTLSGTAQCRKNRSAGKPGRTSEQASRQAHRPASSYATEIERVRRGEHGARSTRQAIAIGLSEARRAGVDLPPPRKGRAQQRTRRSAKYAYQAGQGKRKPRRRPRVSRAVKQVLKREPRRTASRRALSQQAKGAASRRSAASRSAAGRKAVRTKGAKGRSAAARKAARTRARRKG